MKLRLLPFGYLLWATMPTSLRAATNKGGKEKNSEKCIVSMANTILKDLCDRKLIGIKSESKEEESKTEEEESETDTQNSYKGYSLTINNEKLTTIRGEYPQIEYSINRWNNAIKSSQKEAMRQVTWDIVGGLKNELTSEKKSIKYVYDFLSAYNYTGLFVLYNFYDKTVLELLQTLSGTQKPMVQFIQEAEKNQLNRPPEESNDQKHSPLQRLKVAYKKQVNDKKKPFYQYKNDILEKLDGNSTIKKIATTIKREKIKEKEIPVPAYDPKKNPEYVALQLVLESILNNMDTSTFMERITIKEVKKKKPAPTTTEITGEEKVPQSDPSGNNGSLQTKPNPVSNDKATVNILEYRKPDVSHKDQKYMLLDGGGYSSRKNAVANKKGALRKTVEVSTVLVAFTMGTLSLLHYFFNSKFFKERRKKKKAYKKVSFSPVSSALNRVSSRHM